MTRVRSPSPGAVAKNSPMAAAPANQPGSGGIAMTASSRKSSTSPGMSTRSHAATKRSMSVLWNTPPVSEEAWDRSQHVVDHIEIRASDFEASVRFYATVLDPLGIPSWSEDADGERITYFGLVGVVDRRPPTTELHLCFVASAREEVDAFHQTGVEAGFRSNGPPGYRAYAPGYYAAFLLDPDGNNIEALYRDVGNPGHVASVA